MPSEQIGTAAVLLPAAAGVETGPDPTGVEQDPDEQARMLQAVRELHDLELLAGVER